MVWEDGHCERLPSISGFDAMDMLLKEKGLTRGSANDWYAEIESQAEDKLGMLFKKMMVSQVHVVGVGCVNCSSCPFLSDGSSFWLCILFAEVI